ncbi:MAG: zf-HC2 domain-containing protein [Planctomycetota bacterium]|jgi:hypothetical protein|nr:zf-HC2 domain-containing protein [Planctomycetota bacterium]
MNCNEAQKLLPLYAGLDLDSSEQEQVRLHVEQCSLCQDQTNRFQNAMQALASSSESAPSISALTQKKILSAVQTGIAQEAHLRRQNRKPSIRSIGQFWRRSAYAAAAALLLAICIGLLQEGQNLNSQSPEIAQNPATPSSQPVLPNSKPNPFTLAVSQSPRVPVPTIGMLRHAHSTSHRKPGIDIYSINSTPHVTTRSVSLDF